MQGWGQGSFNREQHEWAILCQWKAKRGSLQYCLEETNLVLRSTARCKPSLWLLKKEELEADARCHGSKIREEELEHWGKWGWRKGVCWSMTSGWIENGFGGFNLRDLQKMKMKVRGKRRLWREEKKGGLEKGCRGKGVDDKGVEGKGKRKRGSWEKGRQKGRGGEKGMKCRIFVKCGRKTVWRIQFKDFAGRSQWRLAKMKWNCWGGSLEKIVLQFVEGGGFTKKWIYSGNSELGWVIELWQFARVWMFGKRGPWSVGSNGGNS